MIKLESALGSLSGMRSVHKSYQQELLTERNLDRIIDYFETAPENLHISKELVDYCVKSLLENEMDVATRLHILKRTLKLAFVQPRFQREFEELELSMVKDFDKILQTVK